MALDNRKVFSAILLCNIFFRLSIQVHAQFIVPVTPPSSAAQGVYYEEDEDVLYYTDVEEKFIKRVKLDTKQTSTIYLDQTPAFVIPIEDQPYQFLVGLGRDLAVLTWDYDSDHDVSFTCLVTTVEPFCQGNRFNFGRVDFFGRFWGGTVGSRDDEDENSPSQGSLYWVDTLRPEYAIARVALPNTITENVAWTNDYRAFYVVDSDSRCIISYKYDLQSGAISCPELAFCYADEPSLLGDPSSVAADIDGNLWITSYGDGLVLQVDPNTAELMRKVKLPAANLTSLTFGGSDFDKLYVASEQVDVFDDLLLGTLLQPLSGQVFEVSDLGVTGFSSPKAKLNSRCRPFYLVTN